MFQARHLAKQVTQQQVTQLSIVCAEARAAGTCVGGWPRISTAVKSLRLQAQKENAAFFFLDAGDEFTGTMWDAVYQGQTVAPVLLNMVKPDAMVGSGICTVDSTASSGTPISQSAVAVEACVTDTDKPQGYCTSQASAVLACSLTVL